MLNHLAGWLGEQHRSGTEVSAAAVLRFIGAAEPDQAIDPVTGCRPMTPP